MDGTCSRWRILEKTLNKLIIANWNGRLLTALVSEQEVLELELDDDTSILGNIYIGKVSTVVKNLNSAFVDLGDGKTGYYSLTDNPSSIFPDGKLGKLKAGDEILVQVSKDATRTKDPVLTANLSFAGKYAVVTAKKTGIGFSAKITDKAWKEAVRTKLETLLEQDAGVIVRTNAYGMEEALFQEITCLLGQYKRLLKDAQYRVCYSLLYREEPSYIKSLKSCPRASLQEIVTDDPAAYERVKDWLSASQSGERPSLRLYDDPMVSLDRVYALDTAMRQALQKRVWLKSGGYLVIEPTEAMTVIDVNTGKYSGKKNQEDTIRLINREAAREICHQLRLRNLSGIILIDFIDMKEAEDRASLLEELRNCCMYDPVKTTVVDITKLGLVEMTRRKGKQPLWEQISRLTSQES